ncbi:MAG: class I SAM-dependent methyltransferase [Solirubrobacterales bacterium]|nr:class I SAM-dependent methyltransferase [Solirubrobacterales bacterium]
MNSTATTTCEIDVLKASHRATWDSGDYAAVARDLVTEVAGAAVTAARPGPGDSLLDVATGTGNAAIPSALKGARVTGLDLAPSLLEVARHEAAVAGVDIEWVEADAEDLPFPDASYDKVLSVLGVQFAPHHETCARELARVVRPGGEIILCSWTPEGFIGQFFKTIGPYMPSPPVGASPPPLWGDERHVGRLFARLDVEFEFKRRSVMFRQQSPSVFVDYMARNYGPLLKARERLTPEGRWQELRADLVTLSESFNRVPGGFSVPSEFLLARGLRQWAP